MPLYGCKNNVHSYKYDIYNYQRIQLLYNKYISGMLGGTLDLTWL